MNKGKIIFLNGVSSSGKTTLAKALTKELPDFFHLSIDDFDLVIERMEDRENKRLIPVETEYFFHRNIKMFSDRGVNLIIDHVLHDEFTRKDCLRVLNKYPILFVGVHCSLDELERRERERGDRTIGQARQQLEFVHREELYDLEVNTCSTCLDDNVKAVVLELENVLNTQGWDKTSKKVIAEGEG